MTRRREEGVYRAYVIHNIPFDFKGDILRPSHVEKMENFFVQTLQNDAEFNSKLSKMSNI